MIIRVAIQAIQTGALANSRESITAPPIVH